ncbi:MAG: molybdopterin-dependent oxidoreductase [Gammaproteobacteria bacterium]|nr:molybdopterin-dependent oxidoreductase [Gammaproteobacteria bacterium]
MSALELTRRKFLWTAGIVGAGLVVGYSMTGTRPLPIGRESGGLIPSAFLQITPDNIIRFYCPRDEMGQGVTTGLATLIGEELDVHPADLKIELAGVHADYSNPEFGVQATGGSTSMRVHFMPLRQVAADVRKLLLQAASADLDMPVSALQTERAHILAGGKRFPYGQFVATAQSLELPQDTPLKPKAGWRYIGREFARIDGIAKSTGAAIFGIDVDLPDLHRAVVKRSPVAGGTLARLDAAKARAMPGVTHVLPISTGVAVVAKQFWQAKKAAEALDVTWDQPPLASVSTADLKADYARALDTEQGQSTAERGDPERGFKAARHIIESDYWAPFLAHAPMEPMNAVVRIGDGIADVWSGTQGAAGAQGLVARQLGFAREQVRIHSTYSGGGFGRRGTLSHVIEAAEVAQASGEPIQLIWTREDDIRSGVYRPASLMRVKAGVDGNGTVRAWEAKRVGGNIMPDVLNVALPAFLPTAVPHTAIGWIAGAADKAFADWTVDRSSVEGFYGDYDFPNQVVRHVTREHGLPLSFWRSVGHSYTAFAKESALDELAHQAKMDPVALRIANSNDNPRLQNVVKIAGERLRGMRLGDGRAIGMAAHGSFFSYVAQLAEVSVEAEAGRIRVHKVTCVVDCGQAVNPDIVRAQMEGAVMYGLTAALHGNLELDNGAIRESNFHDYPILRMDEAPEVDVIIVDSDEPPSGVGEPGLPPIAPAVANAVFAATGQRLRSLPLKLA